MSEKQNDTQAQEQKAPAKEGKKVKYLKTSPVEVEELYVDGISGVMARNGVFKLDCYRIAGIDSEDNAEVRRVSHRLVIPAVSMGELIQVVQGVVQSAAKAKEKGQQDDNQTIN